MKDEIVRLLEADEFVSAIGLIEVWLSAEPDNWVPWVLLSGISVRTGNLELGLRAFRKMVFLRPKSSIASSGYFECLFKLGDMEAAKSEMARFASCSDNNETSKMVLREQAEKLDTLT